MADPWAQFPTVTDGVSQAKPGSVTAHLPALDKQDWSAFPDAGGSATTATAPQAAEAFSNQFQGGFLQNAPMVAGGIIGAEAGAATGTALGMTAGPVGAVVGGLGGAALGYLGGHYLKKLAGIGDPEDLPVPQQPWGVAGELVGGGVPLQVLPIYAAAKGIQIGAKAGGNLLDRIIQTAASHPKSFLAAEDFGLSGAAIGGGAAQAYAPGHPGVKFAAEAAGGMFNPTRLITVASRGATGIVGNVVSRLTKEGTQTRAGTFLTGLVKEFGEDPGQLAIALRHSGIPGVSMTAAQMTGSPALSALEAKLRSDSAPFGMEAERTASDALDSMRGMIVALRGTGDPTALKAAAGIRDTYFRTLLASRVQAAQDEAVAAARGITADTPAARAQIGQQARTALGSALDEARQAESELWAQVPRNLDVPTPNVAKAYQALVGEMLPGESLPPVLQAFGADAVQGGTRSSGDLLRFRSRLLALARQAQAQNHLVDARAYGNMAEAALDDLSASPISPQVDAARAFSRELNDTFTRTFAGAGMRTNATGAARIPPELLMDRAFASGGTAGDLQMQQLADATRFMEGHGLASADSDEAAKTMIDAQDRLLRIAAADAIDPSTNIANPKRLRAFLTKNDGVLQRFPAVRADLEAAASSTEAASALADRMSGLSKVVADQTAFGKLMNMENPVDAIASVMRGPRPDAGLASIVRTAKSPADAATRESAISGLKSAAFDYVFRKAGSGKETGEAFDPAKIKTALTAQGFAARMVKAGVFDQGDLDRMTALLDRAQQVEDAIKTGRGLDKIIGNPDLMLDAVYRLAGARLGSAVSAALPGVAGGSSIVVAGIGSRLVRDIFGKMNDASVNQLLIEAAKDPKLAALLLEKGGDAAARARRGLQLHAYLLQAGLTAPEGTATSGPEQPQSGPTTAPSGPTP